VPAKRLLQALGAPAFWGSMPLYLILVHDLLVIGFVAWRTLFTLPICFAALAWSRGNYAPSFPIGAR